jgi:hypothetical protein
MTFDFSYGSRSSPTMVRILCFPFPTVVYSCILEISFYQFILQFTDIFGQIN